MNDELPNKQIIFSVTVDEIQEEAKKIVGRELTEDELYTAIKGIKAGLSFDIDTVFITAIEESVGSKFATTTE